MPVVCVNIAVKWSVNGCDPGLKVVVGKRLVLLMKWQVRLVVACDNVGVKWRGDGCDPGVKVSMGEGLV